MNSYVLSHDDKWFFKKNRIDSLSRSPFSIGDTVVVCSNKHVMLADFYEGECHTCNVRDTARFCYANVEYGYKLTDNDAWFAEKNPTDKLSKKKISVGDVVVICDNQHMTLIESYHGNCPVCQSENTGVVPIWEEPFSWLFPSKFTRRMLSRVNPLLGWICSILFVVSCVLILTGVLSNETLFAYWSETMLPRTQLLFTSFGNFIDANGSVYEYLAITNRRIFLNSNILFSNIVAVSVIFMNGAIILASNVAFMFQGIIGRTSELYELLNVRTHKLAEIIQVRISNIFN